MPLELVGRNVFSFFLFRVFKVTTKLDSMFLAASIFGFSLRSDLLKLNLDYFVSIRDILSGLKRKYENNHFQRTLGRWVQVGSFTYQ